MKPEKTAIEGFEELAALAAAEPEATWGDIFEIKASPELMVNPEVRDYLREVQKKVYAELYREYGPPADVLADILAFGSPRRKGVK